MTNLRVSHSQLQVWNRCESAWEYNYKYGYVPKKEAEYFSVGTFCHEQLATVYQARREGLSWDTAIQTKLIPWLKEKAPEMIATNATAFNRATRIIHRYFAQYAPKADAGIRILDVERHFNVEIPTPGGNFIDVEGYIDLIVEINGSLYIWDHKTIGQNKFWTVDEAMLDPQLAIYTLALRMLGYKVFGTIINQLNTYDYKDFPSVPLEKLFQRRETYRSDKFLEGIGRNIGLMADSIIEKRESDGPYIKSLRKDCKNCAYKEPCTHELKGINPEGILHANFKKKEGRPEEEAPDNLFEDIGVYAANV